MLIVGCSLAFVSVILMAADGTPGVQNAITYELPASKKKTLCITSPPKVWCPLFKGNLIFNLFNSYMVSAVPDTYSMLEKGGRYPPSWWTKSLTTFTTTSAPSRRVALPTAPGSHVLDTTYSALFGLESSEWTPFD